MDYRPRQPKQPLTTPDHPCCDTARAWPPWRPMPARGHGLSCGGADGSGGCGSSGNSSLGRWARCKANERARFGIRSDRDCVTHHGDDSNTAAARCGAGRCGPRRTPLQHCSPCSPRYCRHLARVDTRPAANRARAGAGVARNLTAADLLGGRGHELARISFQPASDRGVGIWLRCVHDLRGGRNGALAAGHVACRRLCPRGDCVTDRRVRASNPRRNIEGESPLQGKDLRS
jgi:hypothetical protein